MTSVGGEATLFYLDEVITGEKNVTEKCIDILGMNASQFKQIVMIAQGEFLELLLAKPKDKASIFRHIFDTAIYKNISDKLKENYLVKKREYEDSSLSIYNYIQNIMLDDVLIDNESTEEVFELLEKEIKKDKEFEQKIEKEKNILYEENALLIKKLVKVKFLMIVLFL